MTDSPEMAAAGEPASPLRDLVADFISHKLAVIGLIVTAIMIVAAILAPVISPQNPYDLMQLNILDGQLPPMSESMDGGTYLLGTDEQGRDMLSAIIYGLRISLLVGLLSTALAASFGAIVGTVAAYAGGRVDALIMRIVDLQLSFPAILVALIILAIMGKGVDNIIIALLIVNWAYFARTARASALSERKREYIEAAHGLRLGAARIVLRHLLPNCLSPLIVIGTIQIARSIMLEATLSFLGVGVPITEPSLGMLISNGYQQMLTGQYWISLYPGIALLVLIMSLNVVSDVVRDVLNPRLQA